MTVVAVILAAFLLIVLGLPLFMVVGAVTMVGFAVFSSTPAEQWGFLIAQKMLGILNKDALLAIPFFVLAGVLMTGGGISRRLIDFARSLVGWFPGGLAVATVLACMVFAAISGSSPATVVAIGMLMFPALTKEGYPEKFGLGLLTSSGSLGILIPPSIPMIVYAIMVEGASVGKLFMAGVLPGLMIGAILAGYSVFIGVRHKVKTEPFNPAAVKATFKRGFFGIMLPVLILGTIYTGTATVNQAAALSVVYAILVEVFIHREIRLRDLPKLTVNAMVEMGAILMIIAMASALAYFMTVQQVPVLLAELLQEHVSTPFGFLLLTNVILLLTGAVMDIISAILILAPIIAHVGAQYGIDPVHLGIIFIVNLEIGYLTPPVGMNLFVATSLFNRPFTQVVMGSLPFVLLMLVALALITYVPEISLWMTRFGPS